MLLNICYTVTQFFKNFIFRDRNLKNVLQEATGSVSSMKMQEPTASNFIVEKEGMINFYQSTWCHTQDDSSLYRHRFENLKYHSKAKNSTSISSSVLKITSCPKVFRIFKIEVIDNKQ